MPDDAVPTNDPPTNDPGHAGAAGWASWASKLKDDHARAAAAHPSGEEPFKTPTQQSLQDWYAKYADDPESPEAVAELSARGFNADHPPGN